MAWNCCQGPVVARVANSVASAPNSTPCALPNVDGGPLTPAQTQALDSRLASFEADRAEAVAWDDLKVELLAGR